MNRAITISLYFLAGVIAFSALADLAIALPVFEIALWLLMLLWFLSLTEYGHVALCETFKLSEAQIGALRLLTAVAFLSGMAVNLMFAELPPWLSAVFK